jgi:hypothetical protein
MSKIVGFILETDEIHKGDFATTSDVFKPDGSFYFAMFQVSPHDEKKIAPYHKNYLKIAFSPSWMEKKKASLHGIE